MLSMPFLLLSGYALLFYRACRGASDGQANKTSDHEQAVTAAKALQSVSQ